MKDWEFHTIDLRVTGSLVSVVAVRPVSSFSLVFPVGSFEGDRDDD